SQPGILADLPNHSRYLTFRLTDGAAATSVLADIQQDLNESIVVGLGQPLLQHLGIVIPGMRGFVGLSGVGCSAPSTQEALWCWIKGGDRGELLRAGNNLKTRLAPAFECVEAVDGFRFQEGRDLSGYVDGTENPQGDDAQAAAIVADDQQGIAGSSFVAVQRWVHDFSKLDAMAETERDDCIGRHIADNEEFDAPAFAHVKRTAQESFEPEAFVVRRSMPWSDAGQAGLMFVAFGHRLEAFEAQLQRMLGLEDGIVDGILRFTQPETGGYYWCPPIVDGRLLIEN
ncbi:MAG: Dyp-type peroxidase, partial [bacterium]